MTPTVEIGIRLNLFTILIIVILIGCKSENLKLLKGDELKEYISRGYKRNTDVDVIDVNGNNISFDSLIKLEYSKKFLEDLYVDQLGIVRKIHLRTAPIMESTFNKNYLLGEENDISQLPKIHIDCGNKNSLLDSIYYLDQGLRNGNVSRSEYSDISNLKFIVSFK